MLKESNIISLTKITKMLIHFLYFYFELKSKLYEIVSLRNVFHIKLISKISIAMLIIGKKFVSIPVILVSRW